MNQEHFDPSDIYQDSQSPAENRQPPFYWTGNVLSPSKRPNELDEQSHFKLPHLGNLVNPVHDGLAPAISNSQVYPDPSMTSSNIFSNSPSTVFPQPSFYSQPVLNPNPQTLNDPLSAASQPYSWIKRPTRT